MEARRVLQHVQVGLRAAIARDAPQRQQRAAYEQRPRTAKPRGKFSLVCTRRHEAVELPRGAQRRQHHAVLLRKHGEERKEQHAGHLPELWPPRRQCALRVALCLAPSLLLSGSRILRKTNEEEQCAERLCSSGRVGHRLGVDGMHREERAASGGDEHVAACGYQSSV